MNSKQIIQKAKEYLTHQAYDPAHDVFHHYRVWENCLEIYLIEGLEFNFELLEIAAWWHDADKINLLNDEEEDHKQLRSVLKEYQVTEADIEKIIQIIDEHSFGKEQTQEESKVLYDADKIEYVSIPRLYMLQNLGLKERGLYEKYWNQRINVVEETMHYQFSKAEFKRRLQLYITVAKKYGYYIQPALLDI